MHPKQRAIIPQQNQAGLPPEILFQPEHVGGSLGLGREAFLEDIWDKLDAEAAAAAELGPPPSGADILQVLNDFVVSVQTVSEQVLPYNPMRTYLMLQNRGAANVFVSLGHTASTAASFQIGPGGGFYEPILGTVSSVHLIAAAANVPVVVVEGFRV